MYSLLGNELKSSSSISVSNSKSKVQELVVGYLPAVKGDVSGRQGISISGAMTYAIEEINNSTDLLPGVKLNLRWNDTEVNTNSIQIEIFIGLGCNSIN